MQFSLESRGIITDYARPDLEVGGLMPLIPPSFDAYAVVAN